MTIRWLPVALVVLSLTFFLSATPPAGAQGKPFRIMLSGAAEVPGPGDADGTGTAELTINPGTGEVCFTIEVENIATPTAAHIHEGTIDTSGGVVVNLDIPGNGLSGCVSADREVLVEILKNPDGYYVNVHNADHPAGAVRGQLSH